MKRSKLETVLAKVSVENWQWKIANTRPLRLYLVGRDGSSHKVVLTQSSKPTVPDVVQAAMALLLRLESEERALSQHLTLSERQYMDEFNVWARGDAHV